MPVGFRGISAKKQTSISGVCFFILYSSSIPKNRQTPPAYSADGAVSRTSKTISRVLYLTVIYSDAISGMRDFSDPNAERSVMQLQLPYYATLEIKDRMTVLELRSLIVADEPHHRYRCEFQSVELFIGIIMSSGADIKVVEPRWLKERLVGFANRVLENNPLDEPCLDD